MGHFLIRQRMRCNLDFFEFHVCDTEFNFELNKKKKKIKIEFVVFELLSNENFEFYPVAR